MRRLHFSAAAKIVLALAVAICAAGPQVRAQVPPPAAGQAAAMKALVDKAESLVDLMSQQKFAPVVAEFDAAMVAAIPEDRLRATWTTLLAQAGPFKKRDASTVEIRTGLPVVIVTCTFERAALDLQFAFKDNKVTGFFVRPSTATTTPYVAPGYVTPSAFTDREVRIGAEPRALPGTLSVPAGAGPFPVVILVHGSGPSDRDETVGATKIFRDLALGLASRGVAVLRYEKRSRQYPGGAGAGFTVKDETIDDVVAAVGRLQNEARIDPKRVFVLGHSLGGMLIPRIAAVERRAAGFIVMAGAARPLEQAMLEQTQYLAMGDGVISPAEQTAIDSMQALVTRVRALTPADASGSTPIQGAPASYWLDLRGYDPPTAARAITSPLLILQGERDYQVTMTEFARWKAALGSNPNATFHSYPALNHLFQPGTGPSLPAEYMNATHVPEEVIKDIASWIAARK